MKKILKIALVGLLFTLVSCENPLDRPYNPETYMEDLQVIVARDKASKSDMINLANFFFKGDSLEGKTYRQLIKEANEFAKSSE